MAARMHWQSGTHILEAVVADRGDLDPRRDGPLGCGEPDKGGHCKETSVGFRIGRTRLVPLAGSHGSRTHGAAAGTRRTTGTLCFKKINLRVPVALQSTVFSLSLVSVRKAL
jgi:hypothetical protein